MSFVRAANPIWFMVDLVGEPLNDEYYAFFLTNTLPYIPQNVYRDPQGMTVWTGNVIQFFPNGTLPNNLYFDPNLVYRIEIRQGNSQTDPLIYEVNNFVPSEGGAVPSNNSLAILGNENQVSNSQFSLINFVSPLTITTAGTYLIAPCWELVLSGAGSTTVTQLIFSGDQDIITNPPYALRINSTGWTESYLRQRFQNNGAIWSAGAVTMSITARAQTVSENISLIYSPNSPGIPQTVASALLGTGDYEVVSGAVDLPVSVNSTLSSSAYTDMIVQLPPTGIVDVTNIQVIGQTDSLPTNFDPDSDIPSYQQEPQERIIDHLFHYYKNSVVTKPKKSILTGWNFPLNPYQFIATAVATRSALTSYIADQTILHQEAASQLQTGKNSVAQRTNLLVKAVTSATQTRFALIQYIDPNTIRPYWSYLVSAFARARIFTDAASSVRLKCRLIYRSSLPATLSDVNPIVSWASNSDPTFAAGWTALSPLNDPAYVLPNAYATDEVVGANAYPAFSFDSFQMPNSDNANMTLGIVVYTMDNLNSVSGHEDSIAFDRVSLISSAFGADAESQTIDEVLRECELYYEKSYPSDELAGATTNSGLRHTVDPLSGDYSSTVLYKTSFNLVYNQVKRVPPTVTFYTPNGASGNVQAGVWNGTSYPTPDVGASNPINIVTSGFSVVTNTVKDILLRPLNGDTIMTFNSPPNSRQGEILYHYVADARLGVV